VQALSLFSHENPDAVALALQPREGMAGTLEMQMVSCFTTLTGYDQYGFFDMRLSNHHSI
jgi:hypothetical protein